MCENNSDSVINGKILGNRFRELCEEYSTSFREIKASVYSQKMKSNTVICFLSRIEELIKEGRVDGETFKNEIKRTTEKRFLHIEIMWFLQVLKIIPLIELISHYEVKNYEKAVEHISSELCEEIFNFNMSMSKFRKEMVIDYIKVVFESCKEESKNGVYSKVLHFVSYNLKQFYKNEENSGEKNLDLLQLIHLFNCAKLDNFIIHKFFQDMLIIVLEGPLQTTKFIVKKQEMVKNNVKGQKVLNFLKIISKYFDAYKMVKIIENVLLDGSKGIDADYLLCFITFIGLHYKDGWASIKTLSNFLLNTSLKTLDSKLLSYVFFTARQGCFEKSNYFPSYLQWFSSTFSSKTKLISNEKICNFFFIFLTDIIPYDSTYYLKVHINRAPWVPSECYWILANYITLAKNQLCDLNVSTELGICENMTGNSAAVFDVENIMKHFERTNEILNSVFQASLFSKNYYEKKFLVELLSKFDGKNSVRHKLILKLHSLGKIPSGLFKNYKSLEKKCK